MQFLLPVIHYVQLVSQGVQVVPTKKNPTEQALVHVLDAVLKIEKAEIDEP